MITGRVSRYAPWRLLGYAVSVAAVLVAWQYFSSRAVITLLFPSPMSTLRVGLGLLQSGQLLADLKASLWRLLAGFAVGSVVGVVAGLVLGSFRMARHLFEPYINFLRFLPALAWIPVVMVWMGTGEGSKVALLAYTTVFIVALSTMAGVTSVPQNQLRAARSFGARPLQTFYLVTFPSTVGHILTGMRLAMGNCFMTVVAAELVASDSGIGYLIFSSRQWMQTELAYVGITVLGVLGVITDRIFYVTTETLLWRYQSGGLRGD
ncbi:MAG: ABC transporter permease [Candidatus Rokubacteria bacterium]|nr:ABC transporter permease [Candidatus Rokubacteria bacterium]